MGSHVAVVIGLRLWLPVLGPVLLCRSTASAKPPASTPLPTVDQHGMTNLPTRHRQHRKDARMTLGTIATHARNHAGVRVRRFGGGVALTKVALGGRGLIGW